MRKVFFRCVSGIILLIVVMFSGTIAQAATLTFVSDTVSTSIPGAPADHTIRFTTTTAVPVLGWITVTPKSGQFDIPTLLDYSDIDLSIGGVEQQLGLLPIGAVVGTDIVSGVNGSIKLTFPAGVAANSAILVKVGMNATVGAIGSNRIQSPLYPGSYRVAVDSYNSSGALLDDASAMIATLFPVWAGNSIIVSAEKDVVIEPSIATTTILTNTNGTTFHVTTPAGVVSFLDNVQLHIVAFDKVDVATTAPPPSGKAEVGSVYELSMTRLSTDSTVSSFSQNVTFNMYYSDADIVGIDESTLKINKWSGSAWTPVSGSTVFASENRVSAQVSSFSMYTIIGDVTVTTPPPPPTPSPSPGGGGGGGGSSAPPASVPVSPTSICRKADLNCDGKVNLVDFSIAAFWYKKANPPANIDISGDGVINLVDFSIMAFYWDT